MAIYNRGVSKDKLKDYKGAIIDYSMAIKINPKKIEAYFNRGLAEIYLGQKESGCIDFSKAGELGDVNAYEMIKKYCN